MRYVRFMGISELERYLDGETLVNKTDWRKKAQCTDSVGFCFFDDSVRPEDRMEYLTGVADLDCVVELEFLNEKKLKKSYGRYRDPGKDDLTLLKPVMMSVPEYSTTAYSLSSTRPVRIGVVVDPYWTRRIVWMDEGGKNSEEV